MTYIGKSVPRFDAIAKVKGEALFPGDFYKPDQLYMKILFARRPHAIIKSIDTTEAEAVKGVIGVLTAKDVPVNEYGLIMPDQPVLCGPGSNKLGADRVLFFGDQVALVIAETEDIAAFACDRISVEYFDLPVITDPSEAMKENTQRLHPDRNSNVFCHYHIRKGDTSIALNQADVIVEGDYVTPYQEHAYLQPEAGLGYIDEEGRITVMVGGQWVHEDQEQIAHALNIKKDKVRVIYPAIGGAFGGREDMSVQIVLALAVWHLEKRGINRPVKIVWSREESIIGHHKRHPFHLHAKWGARKDGKILAAEIEMVADGGAYAYTSTKVLGNATLLCSGPYEIPNIKVDAYAVYTNNVPTGAFRGFGGPQGLFEAEQQINKLAEALGMDSVELRMRNIFHEGSLLAVGTPLPKGVSMSEVLRQCAEKAGWQQGNASWQKPKLLKNSPERPFIRKGLGLACGYKNIGFSFGAPELCETTIELLGDAEIEKAIVHHAGADVGQGAHSVIRQFAAQALKIGIDKVELIVSDTAQTGNSGSASASRLTFMAGNSVMGAAELALNKWMREERPVVATYQYRPPSTTPLDPQTGKSEPNFAYGYVAEAVEVDVDMETGRIHLPKVYCVNDVGQAINPQQVEGQIEGAIVQATGYATIENLIQHDGYIQTTTLSTYLIPTILDIPDKIDSVILQYPDPIGPYGARGMGEMPYLPLVPAITAAIHAATGIWFDEFPLTSERVLKELKKLE